MASVVEAAALPHVEVVAEAAQVTPKVLPIDVESERSH